MKEVSLLISNRDSFEAIQLTIESIRKYTLYPYKIIVVDDKSSNEIDLIYLRNAQDKGWLTLYENTDLSPYTHGGSLNRLTNEICDTDYAVIMDCDIMIKQQGWLTDFMNIASTSNKIIAIVDISPKGYTWKGLKPPLCHFWFGLLNMKAYRDGMQLDWKNSVEDGSREPYKSLFSDLVPPEQNAYFKSLVATGKIKRENWNEKTVSNDPGSQFWMKVTYDNPKGYRVVPLLGGLHEKHCHFGHASIVGMDAHSSEDSYYVSRAKHKFAGIKKCLEELRCQN